VKAADFFNPLKISSHPLDLYSRNVKKQQAKGLGQL